MADTTAPISVVVPVRNEAATLPELLAALIRQSITPAEIVLVDTGSTDSSIAIAQEWGGAAKQAGVCLKFRQ